MWATYEALDTIGHGGYATIRRGRHRASQSEVALKIIDLNNTSLFQLKHALNEATLIQELDHPNVIKIIDFF